MSIAVLGLIMLTQAAPQGAVPAERAFGTDLPRLTYFKFSTISSPQYVGDSFELQIIAEDENHQQYDYSGSALLQTSIGPYAYPNFVMFDRGISRPQVFVTLAADTMQLRCFNDSAVGLSNAFQVLPGVPARLVTVMPGEQLSPGVAGGRLGRPDSRVAGDTFSFRVCLTDAWYNQIDLRDDSVYLGATDRFARLPAAGQLANGSATFPGSVREAGRHRLFARPGPGSSVVTDSSTLFSVVPGTFAEMLLVAPGETLLPGDTTLNTWNSPGKGGTPDVQYLRTPFPVWVYPTDRCWNVISGPGDTVFLRSDFSFDFTPGAAALLEPASFMVQFNAPGENQDLWAVNQATGQSTYRTRLSIRSLSSELLVFAPETVRAGETVPIRVVVHDANTQPIIAESVHGSVIRGRGDLLDPFDLSPRTGVAALTDRSGTAIIRFLATRARMAEQDSVRFTSGSVSATIGIYVDITDSAVMNGRAIAFPNPFGLDHQQTEISYYLQGSSDITLNIYDPFGNVVWSRRFARGEPGARAGLNRGIYWDGRNQKGRRVASGIYVLEVVGDVFTGTTFKSHYRIGVVW